MIHQLVEQNYPKDATLSDGAAVVIRPLGPTDRHRLWSFFQQIPAEDHLFLRHDVSKHATIDAWCKNIDYEKTLPMLALKGEEIIADTTLHQDHGGWLSHIGVVRIMVGLDYRGRGIGQRMMRELIELATLSDLDLLEAEFMAEQARAIASFERLGFERFCVMPRRVRDRKGQFHDLVVLNYDLKRKRDSFGEE